jgi:hypothetical protein
MGMGGRDEAVLNTGGFKMKTARVPKLTDGESALLAILETQGYHVLDASRSDDGEFLLTISGVYRAPHHRNEWKFEAFLPLLAVRELTVWSSEAIALMTDHPEMVLAGDWSGVRDSSHEAIMAIFERHVIRPVVRPAVASNRRREGVAR